jgi:tungstate transport system ATP-binding protein
MDRGAGMKADVDHLLRLADVSLIRAGRPLIDGVSFALEHGSVVMLLGPNGAGKSLLLKICHGLIDPDCGERAWARATPHAYVSQTSLFLRRSALANVLHTLSLVGWPRLTRRRRALRALVKFGLKDFIHHPARRLSGGEQQKLAIARAWATNPTVLLLDEPTASLDPKATKEVEGQIADLRREGVTILMSTHDISQARRLAERILFLHAGRLLEDTRASLFFSGPSTTAARHFLDGVLQ